MNIDFHAHILPGADHGSNGLATSLQQLKLARRARIQVVAATPHFYPDLESLPDFLERRKRTEQQLREALPLTAPQVIVAAEAHLCPGMERIDGLEQLCFPGTNVLLLELPYDYSIRAFEQTMDDLMFVKKLDIVLAHIDRYSSSTVDFLLNLGLKAQINADSFFRFRTKKRSLYWANNLENVVALGSDLHGCATGYRDFLKMKDRLGETYNVIMERTQKLLNL